MVSIIDDAISLRHYLHQHPEVSCGEQNSSAYLKARILEDCQPDELITFEHYGLVAVYKGVKPGKRILIRGDFDALPIQEVNDFSYKSMSPGVSHKCGHDGHAAILYALARQLAIERPEQGDALLLFQPAEENGEGARGMIADPKFARIQPDYVVALHNLPGFELHTLVWKMGPFTAAANSMIIKLYGKTSHAAEPEKGINPALAIAEITMRIAEQNQPDLQTADFRIATPIYSTMGEKSYGVSAGYGELHFTLRAWHNEVICSFEETCEQIAREVASRNRLGIEVKWTEQFFANINREEVIEAVCRAGAGQQLQLVEREMPFKWGEDFGIFTERYPGAMFGLGAGKDCPALHNPDYDFPDELIHTGAALFKRIVQELQK